LAVFHLHKRIWLRLLVQKLCPPTHLVFSVVFQSAVLLTMAVHVASEMHFDALRSLTQPCILCHIISMKNMLPSSADQCILENVYLQSDLSRTHLVFASN